MTISGLHHVSINVDDVAAANHFYIEGLGLEPIERPDLGFVGSWLAAPDGLQVHLIEVPGYTGPEGNHFALAVDDIDVEIAELRSKGLRVPDWRDGGAGRQVFLRDPSGNIVELNQPRDA
jgi:catechol 2,3-dioxygenase-like lactoylglutathione lyase family enzyme